jgi:2',3'-cyclic-nucleotide 2'-phosphodiesterase (5'-nucleotidase family)
MNGARPKPVARLKPSRSCDAGPARLKPARAISMAFVALALVASRAFAQQEEPGAPRSQAPVTFLQINDVYQTAPVDGVGGLARVATIKQRLKDEGRTPFLVLAGDFLSPSVASSVFKGEQVVAALNAIGLDLATLGNHEFDFGDDLLIQRMKEARWQWVVSNVVDRRTGRPIGGAAPYLIKQFGALKVGFIGLCLTTSEIAAEKLTHTRLIDPLTAAGRFLPMLERQGAQVIVAVTHLPFAEDRRLLERFPQIDLVLGGHEHFPITATTGRALISKAGSDAKFVARIDVTRRANGRVERFFQMIPVTADIPDEPRAAEVIATYETRLGVELDAVLGEITVPLNAEAVRLRASEQPIGNLVADMMRQRVDADVAIINSGSIRGDRVYPAGPVRRRALVAVHPFGNVICKVEVAGTVLLQALNSGVSKMPAAAGQFPQVSGLTMTVNLSAPAGNRVRDVKINGVPLDPAKRYTVALPDFLLKGGDAYSMFVGKDVLIDPESGDLLITALEDYIVANTPLAPRVEGRINVIR